MNNLFFFLIPLVMAEQFHQEETKDDFENFPVGYLQDMYRVQADVTAEDYDFVSDAKKVRDDAEKYIEANKKSFDKAEEAIIDLLLVPGTNKVQRSCILTALKDYCDHLSDLIESKSSNSSQM